jgi:hypothetical protein
MKFAYLSVLIFSRNTPPAEDLRLIDFTLQSVAYAHELILVIPFKSDLTWNAELDLDSPLTVVRVDPSASPDSATIAGLARAAGDFIIEWQGTLSDLTVEIVKLLMEPSNFGYELVEATTRHQPRSIPLEYALANIFRPWNQPVRKTVARVYSRHAIGILLPSASAESLMAVLVAELSVKRRTIDIPANAGESATPRRRLWEALSLLSKGTKIGALMPLALASIFGVFGATSAIYALLILAIRGRAPEGWATLMVLIGLGQASILLMIGLIWSRIDALTRGLGKRHDVTAAVDTFGPKRT